MGPLWGVVVQRTRQHEPGRETDPHGAFRESVLGGVRGLAAHPGRGSPELDAVDDVADHPKVSEADDCDLRATAVPGIA